jgi:hypothetical protein
MGSVVNFPKKNRVSGLAAFALYATSQTTFLPTQAYLRGNPFLSTVTSLLPFHRRHFFFLALVLAATLHSRELSACFCTSSTSLIAL